MLRSQSASGQDVPFDIVGGYSKEEYVEFNPEQTVNMFVVNDPMGRNSKALYPTPGLKLDDGLDLTDQIKGGGRATFYFKNIGYVVIKTDIFEIVETSLGLSGIKIGELRTEFGHVGIAAVGDEIMFVDGVDGWIFNLRTKNFTQILAADFPTEPLDVDVLADRFVVVQKDTQFTYFSEALDGTSWNALLNRISMPFYPDTNTAIGTLNGRMYIMGTFSTQPWYNAGAAVVPYRPIEPALEFGCAAVSSVDSAFGILVWLSRTDQGVGSVVATTGGNPQAISTQAIDTEFQKYENPEDASGYIYKNELGHIMYVLSFTKDNKTWMYDFNTRTWSNLEHEGANRHLGQKHLYIGNTHYLLSYKEAKLYAFSNNYYDDDGIKIRRARVSTVFMTKTCNKFSLNRISIDLKQGTGLDCDFEEDPEIFFASSYDGGVSYGNFLTQKIGRIGRRITTTSFYNLGNAKSMVFKLEHYRSVPFVILGCTLNITVSEHGE